MNEIHLLAVNLFVHINCTLDIQYELESIRVTFQTIFQPVEVAQLDGRYDVIISTIRQMYLVTELHLKFPSRSENSESVLHTKIVQINRECLTGVTNISCCVPGLLNQGMGSDRNVARQI